MASAAAGKGKGKKEEVVIPVKDPTGDPLYASESARLQSRHLSRAIVGELLSDVVERALAETDLRSARANAASAAVQLALRDVDRVLALLFAERDGGEVDEAAIEEEEHEKWNAERERERERAAWRGEKYEEKKWIYKRERVPEWTPDEEPQPAPIDAFAKGHVPVIAAQKLPDPPPTAMTGTGQSIRSTTVKSRTVDSALKSEKTNNVVTMAQPAATTTTTSTATHLGGVRKPDVDKVIRNKLSDEDRMMQAKFENTRARHAREAEQSKKIAALQAELRGKDYTYDSEGNILVIKKPEVDRLPAARVPVKAAIKPSTEEQAEIDRMKKLGIRKARKVVVPPDDIDVLANKVAAQNKGKKQVAGETAVFKPYVDWQPPVVENIHLATGVSVREGAKAKIGPREKQEPNRMTKEMYSSLATQIAMSSLGTYTLPQESKSAADTAQDKKITESLENSMAGPPGKSPQQQQQQQQSTSALDQTANTADGRTQQSPPRRGPVAGGPGLRMPSHDSQHLGRTSPRKREKKLEPFEFSATPATIKHERGKHLGEHPPYGFHAPDESKVTLNKNVLAKNTSLSASLALSST